MPDEWRCIFRRSTNRLLNVKFNACCDCHVNLIFLQLIINRSAGGLAAMLCNTPSSIWWTRTSTLMTAISGMRESEYRLADDMNYICKFLHAFKTMCVGRPKYLCRKSISVGKGEHRGHASSRVKGHPLTLGVKTWTMPLPIPQVLWVRVCLYNHVTLYIYMPPLLWLPPLVQQVWVRHL